MRRPRTRGNGQGSVTHRPERPSPWVAVVITGWSLGQNGPSCIALVVVAGPGEATDKARERVRHPEDAFGVAPVNGGSTPRHQRPWAPTAAHGGPPRPSGTGLPPARVAAVRAA
jgi:hypothetical protein